MHLIIAGLPSDPEDTKDGSANEEEEETEDGNYRSISNDIVRIMDLSFKKKRNLTDMFCQDIRPSGGSGSAPTTRSQQSMRKSSRPGSGHRSAPSSRPNSTSLSGLFPKSQNSVAPAPSNESSPALVLTPARLPPLSIPYMGIDCSPDRAGAGRVRKTSRVETREFCIPPENQVTIDVMVHREKSRTPSVVSQPKDTGVDNLAYDTVGDSTQEKESGISETPL